MGKRKDRLPLSEQKRPFKSITYGPQTKESMLEIIKQRIQDSHRDFTIYVGTDSQTHAGTKIVSVIAVLEHGHGGFYFYTIDWTKRYHKEELRAKIYDETLRSIDLAKKALEFFYMNEIDVPIIIHADIGKGKYSKTKDMTDEVVSMISAYGFSSEIKPKSFCASSVADRISK